MRTRHFLVVVSLFCCAAGTAGAQALPSAALGNAQSWSTFDWVHAQSSAIWQSPAWSAPQTTGEAAFEDKRSAPVTINGQDFEARTYTDRTSTSPTYKLQVTGDGVPKCNSLREWGRRTFGQGMSREASYTMAFGSTPDTQLRMINETYQWISGHTGVTLECIGTSALQNDDGRGSFAVMTFRSATETERLIPLSAIRCQEQGGSRSVVFVLDEYMTSVLRADLSPFAIHAIFTEGSIQFQPTGNSDVTYSINRITGQLIIRSGNISAEMNCDHTELGSRRF